MLGAFTGDALGSYVEFSWGDLEESKIDEAMSMPGDGYWHTYPGQVTDDSELAMC